MSGGPAPASEIVRTTLVVVPCYNESDRLRLAEFEAFADDHEDIGFLFVDDGSTDGTPSMIEAIAARRPDAFQALRTRENRGKASAVRLGLREAIRSGARLTGFWDADLAAPLQELAPMVRRLENQPELGCLLGSRVKMLGFRVQRTRWRHYLGRVFATLASLILGMPIYDTQCGAKLFRVTSALDDALDEPFESRWVFDVELIARLRDRFGAESAAWIEERPLRTWCDVTGSKLGLAQALGAGRDLLVIAWRSNRSSGSAAGEGDGAARLR